MNKEQPAKFKKKNDLIEAAFSEFSKKSFDNTSLTAILENAKISKGYFYYHFNSKEDLYIHLFGIFLKKKEDYIIKNTPNEIFSKDFFGIIKNNVSLGLGFGSKNKLIYNFSEMFMKERGNTIYTEVLNHYGIQEEGYIKTLIDKAVLNGDLRDDIPVDVITSMINHILLHVNSLLDIKNIKDYESKIDFLLLFLEKGLKKD